MKTVWILMENDEPLDAYETEELADKAQQEQPTKIGVYFHTREIFFHEEKK